MRTGDVEHKITPFRRKLYMFEKRRSCLMRALLMSRRKSGLISDVSCTHKLPRRRIMLQIYGL